MVVTGIRFVTALLMTWAPPPVHGPPLHDAVMSKCSDEPIAVQVDVHVPLRTDDRPTYLRMKTRNGFVFEIDRADTQRLIATLPHYAVVLPASWKPAISLFLERLHAARAHPPLDIEDMLHADEYLSNLHGKNGPALEHHVQITFLWQRIFLTAMKQGESGWSTRAAGKRLRGCAYASTRPADPAPQIRIT